MPYDGSQVEWPTLAEIRTAGLGVRAECGCGHHRTIDPRRVCAPSAIDLAAFGALLACSKCGQEGLSAFSVAPLDRTQRD